MALPSSRPRRLKSEADSGRQLAQSVDRALSVLEAFSARRPELGVQELANTLNTSPSTASRLLAALANRGYVQQDPTTGRFRLGLRALEIGYRFADTSELMIRAAPHVDALAQQLKLTAELYGLDGGQLIRYMSARYPSGQAMIGGCRFYPYNHSAGKVLLAHLCSQELEATLSLPASSGAPLSSVIVEDLREQLSTIALRGYAADDEGTTIGKRCLSVPVHDASGSVVAALAVSGPASRLPDDQVPTILEVLFDRAHEFSKSLGYRPHQAICEPSTLIGD